MTYAIRIQAPADRNGNNRFGWIVATHGCDLEGFIMQGALSARDALHQGILAINRILERKKPGAGLGEGPYQNNLSIRVSVAELRRLKALAKNRGTLVGF